MQAVLAGSRRASKQKIWPALTLYRKLGEKNGLSFLQLEMETGVTHQLRAHLAMIGYPILGDRLYGSNVTAELGLQRHFLHASGLQLLHPASGNPMKLDAPLPEELEALLMRLNMPLRPVPPPAKGSS
jgi:23S rRNA-/tRNA-specific pseudouridylate synthase